MTTLSSTSLFEYLDHFNTDIIGSIGLSFFSTKMKSIQLLLWMCSFIFSSSVLGIMCPNISASHRTFYSGTTPAVLYSKYAGLEVQTLGGCKYITNTTCCNNADSVFIANSISLTVSTIKHSACAQALNLGACAICDGNSINYFDNVTGRLRLCMPLCQTIYSACLTTTSQLTGDNIVPAGMSENDFCKDAVVNNTAICYGLAPSITPLFGFIAMIVLVLLSL